MLANAYDRLRSERHISHQKVVDLLQNGTDGVPPSHFDPDLLASLSPNEDCFIGLYGHSAP
jgi:hypothetical protein